MTDKWEDQFEEVTGKSHSQYETWFVVYADGRVKKVFENDGHACLRHGIQRSITWSRVEDHPHNEKIQAAWQRLINKQDRYTQCRDAQQDCSKQKDKHT